jgi:hypothetical protein
MSEVSRPLQVVLLLTVAFAGLWFVALRPKTDTGGGAPPAPAPAPAAKTQPAQPAQHKSSLPGGLGRAVDKANATKQQGDGQAATTDRAGSAPETGAPAQPAPTPAPAPRPSVTPTPASTPSSPAAVLGRSVGASVAHSQNAAVSAGATAMGMVSASLFDAMGLRGRVAPAPAPASAPARPGHAPPPATRHVKALPGVTPGMVRQALGRGDVVVLLFWNANSSDDRLVRSELSQVDRRGGRVHAWPVSASGLARFKNVLRGIDVVQAPTVVVMARGAEPRMFEGYTDHAEIDQATLLDLTRT